MKPCEKENPSTPGRAGGKHRGALVIGQSAVQAGGGQAMIIVIAFTASILILSDNPYRCRYFGEVLAGTNGWSPGAFGIVIGLMGLLVRPVCPAFFWVLLSDPYCPLGYRRP